MLFDFGGLRRIYKAFNKNCKDIALSASNKTIGDIRQGTFEPEERSKGGMQALSPTHSPYSTTNAQNQIRNKAVVEFRGSRAASFTGSRYIKGRYSIAFPSTIVHNAVS